MNQKKVIFDTEFTWIKYSQEVNIIIDRMVLPLHIVMSDCPLNQALAILWS